MPDLLSMRKCIDDVKTSMKVNKLRLNDDKIEAMVVSSIRSLGLSLPPSQTRSMTPMWDSVRYLNSHLTMKTHVSNPVHSDNFELRCISSIRHVLSVIIIVIIVIFCPRMSQTFLPLPLFFHALAAANPSCMTD